MELTRCFPRKTIPDNITWLTSGHLRKGGLCFCMWSFLKLSISVINSIRNNVWMTWKAKVMIKAFIRIIMMWGRGMMKSNKLFWLGTASLRDNSKTNYILIFLQITFNLVYLWLLILRNMKMEIINNANPAELNGISELKLQTQWLMFFIPISKLCCFTDSVF